jgi:hypothetical protein
MDNNEVIYVSDWEKLKHPFMYDTNIGEYKIILLKKHNKKKWVAMFQAYQFSNEEKYRIFRDKLNFSFSSYENKLKEYENQLIYLPLKHCSKSPSCINRAKLEAVIWAEELFGFRDPCNQVDIDGEKYLQLNNENFRFDWRDNRSKWGTDLIYTTVTDGNKTYHVVYYVSFYPLQERYPEKFSSPKIDIGYYREDYFYFAMDLLNPYLDKIHEIVNEHYKQKYENINYNIIYRQNYRELVI